MRISLLLLALTLAASPAAAQAAAPRHAAPLPQRLRPPASAPVPVPAQHDFRLRHAWWGLGIGAAAGLAWGLSNEDQDVFGLSPVLETTIGAGVGFLVGGAVDVVRTLRSRPPRSRPVAGG